MVTLKSIRNTWLLLAILTLVIGCGGGSSSDDPGETSVALKISGMLGSAVARPSFKAKSGYAAKTLTLNELEVYGLAFSDPPEVQTVDVGTDGSFTLTFSAAVSGSPISLIFRYKTGTSKAGEEVGVVKFVDDSEKDMDGNSSSSTTKALQGTVSLGNMQLNEDGDITVPIARVTANVANDDVDTGEVFDFSGNWEFASYDDTLPTGYSDLCAAGSNNCDGPEVGMPIILKRIDGKKYIPDTACAAAADNDTFDPDTGTCAGSVTTEDRFMIQVWKSQTAANSCSNRLGFTYEAGKAYARVDFSSSGVTEGEFDWSNGYVDGWKDVANARSKWHIDNCGPTEVMADDNVTKHQGWKCTDTSGNYEVGLEGGCRDGNQNPVHVTDWSIVPDSCVNGAADGLTGFEENSCTYTNADPDGSGPSGSISFQCKHVYGEFDSNGSSDSATDGFFDWNNVAIIYNGESSFGAGDGDLCSSVTPSNDEEEIAKLRCYADYFWEADLEEDENSCVRRVETDWAAETPEDFILKEDGPARAGALFVLSNFEYDSANSGFFEDGSVHHNGVQTGDNWTNCKVKEHFRMTIKKRSATQLVSEFVTATQLLDTDKDACVADAESVDGELGIGVSKSIMLLNKI